MNRVLQWFNLAGVLVLASLCVLQWRANRLLNLEVNRRQQQRLEQTARLEEHAKTSRGQASDLTALRSHLGRLTDELRQTTDKLAAAQREARLAQAERDQLKSNVATWAAAVAERDERLKNTTRQLATLALDRDHAVKEFNELAARHNQLVREWNELQARLTNQAQAR